MKKLIVAAMICTAMLSFTAYGSEATLQKTEVSDREMAEDIISVTDTQEETQAAEEASAGEAADGSTEMARSFLTGPLEDNTTAMNRPIAIR